MTNTELIDIIKSTGPNKVANLLEVSSGTVKRWLQNNKIPTNQYIDLYRIFNIQVDYTSLSEKQKDQFFTNKNTAKYCYNLAVSKLKEFGVDVSKYMFIEPSAGDGSFFNILPKGNRIGLDIEPRAPGIQKHDFLVWQPPIGDYITLGNPPFGTRGGTALKFINHAGKFSDFVCFILPQTFDSNGKGSCKKRVMGLNLIYSEIVDSSFYYPNGTIVSVNVVFQIWAKNISVPTDDRTCNNFIKVYSLSDGGTPGSTRNINKIDKCDIYLPITCFSSESMKVYSDFETLPNRRGFGIIISQSNKDVLNLLKTTNWSDVAFRSTNGAYNLRSDLIKGVLIQNGFVDKTWFEH